MTDPKDTVILLTGSTAGIGRAAAHTLAATGATLVAVARNEAKAKALVEHVRKDTHNESVSYLLGDLSRPSEVRQVASAFRTQYDRLDVLFNNAGAIFVERQLTEDGLERTFAVNHMAYFILAIELLDMLKASAPSRIVSTSSAAHAQGDLAMLDDLQNDSWGTAGMKAYGRSKLANIWFTRELARKLAGSGVTANCFHPGFVASDFGRNNGVLATLLMMVSRPFQRNARKGADTGVWLATSPDVEGQTGGYYYNRAKQRTTRTARDDAAPARLWAESERILAEVVTGGEHRPA